MSSEANCEVNGETGGGKKLLLHRAGLYSTPLDLGDPDLRCSTLTHNNHQES